MKKILILLLILLALTACTVQVVEDQGEDAEVEIDGEDVSIEYSDGETDVVIEGENLGSDEWCDDDSLVNIVATGEDAGTYRWEVVGIVVDGEYAGLCHMKAFLESSEVTIETDYYVDEEGETVHMQLNSEGMDYDIDYSS